MNFTAIDVETANADMASICSIGAVKFENGKIAAEWYSLVDPGDYFDGINVSIHGIDKHMVKGAPTYVEAAQTLNGMLKNTVAVAHSHFDRVAIHQAASRSSVATPSCTWLDSARVARRAWPECASRGYGLADVCSLIGYKFQHHHALEDAKASGQILLAAMQKTGLDIDAWLGRVRQPIDVNSNAPIRRDGDRDGPLFGEVLVFTGALAMPRREAADLAASAGCRVESGVTKTTTVLVVGDIDVRQLAGHERSSKHRKAEGMLAKGHAIRIIRETDFRELIAMA